jgi:hypothetical protein
MPMLPSRDGIKLRNIVSDQDAGIQAPLASGQIVMCKVDLCNGIPRRQRTRPQTHQVNANHGGLLNEPPPWQDR